MRFIARTAVMALGLCGAGALGQNISPPFNAAYSLSDLGTPPGVPAAMGGVCFLRNNPNVLLIGGHANNIDAAIYAIGVTRDANQHITGFSGAATLHAAAAGIDGGLTYAPNGTLLYTTYSNNVLGQILPGGWGPAQTTDLSLHGVFPSTGTLQFVPPGFPGAGTLLIVSYSANEYYTMPFTPGLGGLYEVGNAAFRVTAPGGPEGIVYVPRQSVLFPFPSMLVSEYGFARVSHYQVGPNGEPLPETRQDFISNLPGAEGGTLDPVTNDFVFSTFTGGNSILVVRGFTPPACNLADMGRQGGQPVPDHLLDNNDFVVFIDYFFNHNALADLGRQGGIRGSDSLFDNNDFVIFIDEFFSPCTS
jgi:hypothetical protein